MAEADKGDLIPRKNNYLLGFEKEEQFLLEAWKNNTLHNSWLFSGIEGIGKATLAYKFARFVLYADYAKKDSYNSLNIPEASGVFNLVSNNSHPDLKIIERDYTDTDKKKFSKPAVLTGAAIACALVLGIGFWMGTHPGQEPLYGVMQAKTVDIAAKVTGRVETLITREGDTVSPGQVLMTLDIPEVEAKLKEVEALKTAATAKADLVDEGARPQEIRAAKAQMMRAQAGRDLAQKTYVRVHALYRDGLVSKQKHDEALAQKKSAEELYSAAKEQYDIALTGARQQEKQAAAQQPETVTGPDDEQGFTGCNPGTAPQRQGLAFKACLTVRQAIALKNFFKANNIEFAPIVFDTEKATEILTSYFNCVYCGTCAYDSPYGQPECDECHRKAMNWALSEASAAQVAEMIKENCF